MDSGEIAFLSIVVVAFVVFGVTLLVLSSRGS